MAAQALLSHPSAHKLIQHPHALAVVARGLFFHAAVFLAKVLTVKADLISGPFQGRYEFFTAVEFPRFAAATTIPTHTAIATGGVVAHCVCGDAVVEDVGSICFN